MSSDEPGDRPVSGMHVPALDGLRGLAVLLVTLYRFGLDPADNSVIGRLAHPLFAAGESGVDLFFVLSGFLITGILADTKERSHYLRNFYMRRVLRIFPLYYGGLALAFWGGNTTGDDSGIRGRPVSPRVALDILCQLFDLLGGRMVSRALQSFLVPGR